MENMLARLGMPVEPGALNRLRSLPGDMVLGGNALAGDVAAWARNNPLDAAALAVSPVPGLGDVVGVANDLRHYATDPESRNWLNYMLTAAGALPLIPSLAGPLHSAIRRSPADMGGGSGPRALAMDEASRLARAQELGYREETFWRGESAGSAPTAYPGGAFFSRDRAEAAGHAGRGGGDPREFRLKIARPLQFGGAVTLGDWADLVEAAGKTLGLEAAQRVVDAAPIAGQWPLDRFLSVARQQADTELTSGAAAYQLLERATGSQEAVLRAAGFDAIDTGRDVRKLDDQGIRLRDAEFDPTKADQRDIRAGLLTGPTFA